MDQWISGVYITEGTHRFTVTLIDWDTKETVAEKTITLNVVKPSKTTSSSVSSNSEFPEWFLEMAKLNGWTVPTDENQDVAALKTTIESQNRAISDMQIAIADLKASGVSQTPVQNPVQSPTNNDAEDKKYYWAAGLAIIAYLKRDWIREKISSDDSSDNDDVFTQRTRLPPEVNESVFDDLRT
ncbi:MAG TPA: hypothetical protein DCG34_01075 [Clostridiales bacterium]|nr:hypothetical protein [Clostridiales bacterium]